MTARESLWGYPCAPVIPDKFVLEVVKAKYTVGLYLHVVASMPVTMIDKATVWLQNAVDFL